MIFKRCEHNWKTVSNYYGDYIDVISLSMKHIYRSKQMCTKCHKIRYSTFLDPNCKIINDGHYIPSGEKT